jgi:hypothetical protein
MQMEVEARGGWGDGSPAWGQEEGARGSLDVHGLREPQLARETHRGPERMEYQGGVSGAYGEVWGWGKGDGTQDQRGAAWAGWLRWAGQERADEEVSNLLGVGGMEEKEGEQEAPTM